VRAPGEVTAWNFDKSKGGLVDMAASAENFIKCMTNKCTYLRKEDVLAKNSMLYSKFSLLNELNNLKVDGKRIEPDMKQKFI
jgi:CRISPR-associated endonuclease Csn1